MTADLPPPVPIAPEAALVERARRGDAEAFREIFRLHAPRVWRFSRDLLGAAPAADECAQETFVRAHAALTSGVAVERLGPWLLGVARNVARELRRDRARTVAVPEPVDDLEPAPSPDPEAVLVGREADAALDRALARLTDERREALLLRVDQRLGYDDIAAALGWTVARVKNEIHRARLQLRASLAQHLCATETRHAR